MTTLPLSDNPECEVWDPELCTCPTDRHHVLGQNSPDPRHGHIIGSSSSRNGEAELLTDLENCPRCGNMPKLSELWNSTCKCSGVTDSAGKGSDCLDFKGTYQTSESSKRGEAWCYTAAGACPGTRRPPSGYGNTSNYEQSTIACSLPVLRGLSGSSQGYHQGVPREFSGELERLYSNWDWPYTVGTVASRCYVDARLPMLFSVFATVGAMLAKELVGILVVIFIPKDSDANILEIAADSVVSALYLIYRIVLDCCRPKGLRAAMLDPTGKNPGSKRLTPMKQVLPKLFILWKLLTFVEVLSSLVLVATAFYQIITFRGYITDHIQQPYEGTSNSSLRRQKP